MAGVGRGIGPGGGVVADAAVVSPVCAAGAFCANPTDANPKQTTAVEIFECNLIELSCFEDAEA